MSLFRPATVLRSQSLRALPRAPRIIFIQQRFATQDYGSGKGDPAGEKPQEQGKNPMSHMEHPGPDAPNVGGGKASSSSSSTSESSSSSSSSSSKSGGEGKSEGKEPKAGEHIGYGVKTEGEGKPGAKPKILDAAPPVEESESTRKHNEEMDRRETY